MCRVTQKKSLIVRRSSSLLLSTKSFRCEDSSDGAPPPISSCLLTSVFLIAFLYLVEHIFRFFLKDTHPLLATETGYKILARHVGVDFTCCAVVAYLGLKNSHLCHAMWYYPSTLHPSGSEKRMFTYHPESHQILLFFLAYQIKNLFDTIIWDDGPEYVFHHIAAGSAAFFGMYPGYAHFYAIFFMGISEISTAVLVLLANFDEKLGIEGFSDAFPRIKIVLGACFVILFILCRVIMWPIATYFFLKDAQSVIKLPTPKVKARKVYIISTMVSLTGLSILQAAWLYQIYAISKVEIAKLMEMNH